HPPGAHEVSEVARGSAIVEEMPAADRQPDLDGVARAPGVPPAMAVKATELAAVVGADDPIPPEAKATSESAAEGVLAGVPDPVGHVNNAVFLPYIEQARVAFFAEAGAATGLEDMTMIVARVEIDFKAPVRLGQEVEISVRASRFGTKSFDLDYQLNVDGQLVAAAKSVQVAYDYGRREPIPLPADWREKLTAVAA